MMLLSRWDLNLSMSARGFLVFRFGCMLGILSYGIFLMEPSLSHQHQSLIPFSFALQKMNSSHLVPAPDGLEIVSRKAAGPTPGTPVSGKPTASLNGWEEIVSRNSFSEYKEGFLAPPNQVAVPLQGATLSRMFMLKNPLITSCQPGRIFDIVINSSMPLPTGRGMMHLSLKHNVGVGAGPLLPRNTVVRGLSATTLSEFLNANKTASRSIVVLLQRGSDMNHFHYSTLLQSFKALSLCDTAARHMGFRMRDISCVPVATHNVIGRPAKPVEATVSEEFEQFKSFQKMVFGRAFLEPCDDLNYNRVLAVVFGEVVHPLANYPQISSRYMARYEPKLRKAAFACTNLHENSTDLVHSDKCGSVAQWRRCMGFSTDLPFFSRVHTMAWILRERLLPSQPLRREMPRTVALFQRSGCPFPGNNDTGKWKSLDTHNRRCLVNIHLLRDRLTREGFTVSLLDFGLKKYATYTSVLAVMSQTTIFVGVEGSGSLHHIWMPAGASGFLQLHPKRDGDIPGALDLYTEAWSHYFSICVHNFRLGNIHQVPLDPEVLARAADTMYFDLSNHTCVTCLLNSRTAVCRQ
jgi:hypothetical protein